MQKRPPCGELHYYHHGQMDQSGDPPAQQRLSLPSKSESSSSPSRGDGKETCHRSSSSSSSATSSITTMESKRRTPDSTEVGLGGGAKTSKSSKASSQSVQSHPHPQCRQRMQLSSVLKAASTRWLTVTEMMQLLDPDTTPLTVSSDGPDPQSPPPSGSLLLYDRADTPNYRDDGHHWVMKRVERRCRSGGRGGTKRKGKGRGGRGRGRGRGGDGADPANAGEGGESGGGSLVRVREDSVKLRYNGRFHVAGYYAKSAVRRTFRRRSYYLVDPTNGSRPLSNWILVHYLDSDPRGECGGGGDDCGGDAPGTLVAPTPALVSGAEKTTVGLGTAAAASSISGYQDEPRRLPPPGDVQQQSIGGGGCGTGNENDDPPLERHRPLVSEAFATRDESCRPFGLVTVPGMMPGVGAPPVPAAPGAAHYRRVEHQQWDDGGSGAIGGGGQGTAMGDDEPHDLLHPAASLRGADTSRPPLRGAGSLGSSAPVITAATALGVTVDCGKGIGSVDTMDLDGGPNPCLHLRGGQPETPPEHHLQQEQTQPQHQPQTRTQSRHQPGSQPQLQHQSQLQPQPQPQPPLQTQLQLKPRNEHQRVGASSSLARILRSLSDLRNAPKLNDEHLEHEWRSYTEEERRDLIADLYGSAMVDGGGTAGENGGTVPIGTGASAGASGCAADDNLHAASGSSSPPQDGAGGGGTSPFILELMAEVDALRMSLMDEAVVEGMPSDCADRAAYLEATRRCPEQASSRRMKSWFLWCEDLCPKAAAHRMVRYWKKRVEYFGPERAFLPFTLGDGGALGSEEFYDELATGFARLMPGTDASGRGIMFMDNWKRCSFAARVRIALYMSHAALENESVVRNGIILVAFGPIPVQHADRRLILERQQLLRDSLPVKIRVVHWCNAIKDNGDWISRDAHEVANFTAGRRWRARVLLHQGSREHIVLQLAEYGISVSQLPAEIGGSVGEDGFQQWLASRRMRSL